MQQHSGDLKDVVKKNLSAVSTATKGFGLSGTTCEYDGRKMVVTGSFHPDTGEFDIAKATFILREANASGKVDLRQGEGVQATLAELTNVNFSMGGRSPALWLASIGLSKSGESE